MRYQTYTNPFASEPGLPRTRMLRPSRSRSKLFLFGVGVVAVMSVVCLVFAEHGENHQLGLFGMGGKKKPVRSPQKDLVLDEAPPSGSNANALGGGGTGTGGNPLGGGQNPFGLPGGGNPFGNVPQGPGGMPDLSKIDFGAMANSPIMKDMASRMGLDPEAAKKLFSSPQFVNQVKSATKMLMNPNLLKDLQNAAQNDPTLAAMTKDIQENGPSVWSKWMQKPEVQAKLQAITGKHIDHSKLPQPPTNAGKIFAEQKEEPQRTELVKAIFDNDIPRFDMLMMKDDVDINQKDKDGYTPLHWATTMSNSNFVTKLLNKGADAGSMAMMDERRTGLTPLHIACTTNCPKCIELLVKHGAPLEVKSKDGFIPFDILMKNPLHRPGSQSSLLAMLRPECKDIVNATRFCDINKVKELLGSGSRVDSLDYAKMTPAHWAARQRDPPIFNVLAKHADFVRLDQGNSRDSFLNTPLHYACGFGSPEIAQALVDLGSDVSARNKNSNRPWALLAKDAIRQPKFKHKEWKAIIPLLYGMPKDPKETTKPKRLSPLQAAIYNDTDAFNSAKGDMNEKDENGRTAAHWAARRGNIAILQQIHKKSSSLLNATDVDGDTPLHVASFVGTMQTVNYLCDQAHASGFTKNKFGISAYDYGRIFGGDENYGADLERKLAGLNLG